MSFPRLLIISALLLFGAIGITAGVKKLTSPKTGVQKTPTSNVASVKAPAPKVVVMSPEASSSPIAEDGDFPQVDRISELFSTGPKKLPIVETVTYASQVPWLKGKPAWIADYAAHYGTSRHFIARSLNGKRDYSNQRIATGNRFNVFRKDRNFQFYLLVDLSLCKMGFYYIDLDTHERVLLKTYKVGVGKEVNTPSGSLTPLGRYSLGSKIAVYKPGIMGQFQDKQVEMIRVFGTRWIPFEQELGGCTAKAKGYGIQGAPWLTGKKEKDLIEVRDVVGKRDSDGCIRLVHEDMEELFSIVITKPTIIEIVKHFKDARLPGVEVVSPAR